MSKIQVPRSRATTVENHAHVFSYGDVMIHTFHQMHSCSDCKNIYEVNKDLIGGVNKCSECGQYICIRCSVKKCEEDLELACRECLFDSQRDQRKKMMDHYRRNVFVPSTPPRVTKRKSTLSSIICKMVPSTPTRSNTVTGIRRLSQRLNLY